MKTPEIKNLIKEFKENLKINHDIKKKIGLILVVKQNFFLKLKI